MIPVCTEKAPAAIGPYSQAIAAGSLVFTSGQLPVSPETGETACGGISGQARQSCENVRAVLEAAGSSMEQPPSLSANEKRQGKFLHLPPKFPYFIRSSSSARRAS